MNLLGCHRVLTVDDFCRLLGVSPATVRRDLAKLDEEGKLRRIANGAVHKEASELSMLQESGISLDPFLEYKKEIATMAVSLVKPGDTVFIDSGSTNNEIANLLVDFTDISIITNSVEIAHKFIHRNDVSLIVCGGTMGEVRPISSIVGPLAEMMIAQFRATLCFIGTSGIDMRQGITDPYLSAARIKQKMIDNSSKVVLVTDHSKFNRLNKVFVCPLNRLDTVITDSLAPNDALDGLQRLGIETVVCDTKTFPSD